MKTLSGFYFMRWTNTFQFHNKTITVTFRLTESIHQTASQLFSISQGMVHFRSSIPNEIVLSLNQFLESKDTEARYIYRTPSPYWFYHDVCHAYYTPFLFKPQIIEIHRQVEDAMLVKGIELARASGLDEYYISLVPELKHILEPTK